MLVVKCIFFCFSWHCFCLSDFKSLSVSRIEARSEQFDMYMQLDVNTEVYPMKPGDKFTMVLASTLSLDGTPDSGFFTQVFLFC